MRGTGTDCFGGMTSTKVDGRECGHVAGDFADVGGAIITEYAIGPESPALDPIIIENGAGMPQSAAHRFGGFPYPEIDKR